MKVFLDTNIYISHYRFQLHQELLYQLNAESTLYLHALVLAELYAGAKSKVFLKELERLDKIFRTRERILLPSLAVYREAGKIIQKNSHIQLSDAVLAASARQEGMMIVTEDGDFLEIQKQKAFKVKKVDQLSCAS